MGSVFSGASGSPAPFGAAPAPLMAPVATAAAPFASLNAPLVQVPQTSGLPAPDASPAPSSASLSVPTKGEAVAEISPIERAMQGTSNGVEKAQPQELKLKNIRQFGYDFFRPESQGFAALTDIPVGPDYILGAGDRIVLTLWGSVEGSYELEINRSGEIVLPKVGTVTVAGVPFGQLPALLKARLSTVFRDFQLNVTMGKLRLIKVYLVGEVSAPGDYSISSLSTLINALSAAGGPTRNGSLRSIAIMRAGKVAETVDLYDFFLKGDKSRDIRLQPGDTIFVPRIGPVAGIAGNVRRPAIYELKGEKTLKDLLALADGINPTGYLQRIQIARVVAHDKKIVTDINLDPKSIGTVIVSLTSSIPLQDMDLVKVFPIDSTLRGYVRLEGYVLRPGDYALKPGMRVDDLLQKDDNLLPEYYTTSGQIIRLCPPDFHPEVIYFNIDQALAKNPAQNLELHEFDTVRIFSRWEMEEMPHVIISGEVQKPGSYRLLQNMRVRDLLTFAGNPKLTAYLKDAELTRLNRSADSVTSYSIKINLNEAIKGSAKDNILLEPFDEITIRRIPNWADETERYITLKGEFVFPGTYPLFKGEKLSSVIRRAGGFTDKAYLKGAKFTRASVRDLQQKRMDEFITTAEMNLNTKMAEQASTASSPEELAAAKASLEGVHQSLLLLKNAKAEGRMVIKLTQPERFVGSNSDIQVMGGDVLEVPQSNNSVSVLGRVVNPTSFIRQKGKDVDYYLEQAGGTTQDSEASEVYVVRANGSIFSNQQYSTVASLFGQGFYSQPVEAGDVIVVPQRYDKTPVMRSIKDITT
ncbi:MAG: polysaccharide biosynthesis protein, partial [Proteobacteria bacterium]|nr:polysaccharide biosynthesis protein [Pseudomonadota bacterium]